MPLSPSRTPSLTGGPEEEQHQTPVEPEEEQGQEGAEGLQGEQRQVDEHLAGHVEQGDGQRHALPHEQHQQEKDHLKRVNQRMRQRKRGRG